ncbi:hypothetical protein GCM10007424_04830 [Flavobacterium suaedae]|uniref:DUF4249 domain-containing protein n=1 Tax=Flavobacterium suaedae TaxID=1767027 RepID=A0ABQ1JGD2_9FLAO|nr:DUF4249 domain-containing protein [Flavobacterium suaedae]GGB67876.1 hypothetical protein GCM10007424_04830 [Flavobacterium suaedae]
MKKKLYLLFTSLVLLSVILTSCEDVIDVDLGSSEKRLVVEASINWKKGTAGEWQVVYLSTTTDFYSNNVPRVSGAEVYITNSKGDIFEFPELSNEFRGSYGCTNFVPEIGETYTLTIHYNNNTYTATEKLLPVPELVDAGQETESLLEDLIIVKGYFNDPQNEVNYYMSGYEQENKGLEYAVFDDKFVNGNYTYAARIFDDLNSNDEITINLYGITRQYYDYMSKIFTITSEANVGPFQVPPGDIRGNIKNSNNPDDFAYGYFRLSEVSTIQYTVQ